jgi:hypothetical protein
VVGPTGFEPVTYRLMPKEIDVDTEKEGKFLGEMKIWGINNRTKRKPTVLLQVGCEDLSKKPFKVYIGKMVTTSHLTESSERNQFELLDKNNYWCNDCDTHTIFYVGIKAL